jgi:poly(beta-D-mannuronate) lyase
VRPIFLGKHQNPRFDKEQTMTLRKGAFVLALAAAAVPAQAQWSGYYRIMARHSGKAVVVQGASTANGGDVVQWAYGGSATNDEWEIVDAGSGYHRIVNRQSGKVLNVAGASTANGANVDQWSWAGVNQQQWQIGDLGDGYHRLTARHSGKVLNVAGASTADGANVDQWGWANVGQQQFQIVSLGAVTPGPTPTPTPTSPGTTPTPTPTPTTPPTGCTTVSTSSALASAVAGAGPGTCIQIADGSYSGFTVTADGTASSPITIRAVNRGGATINSGGIFLNGASYVTIEGLRVTSQSSRSVDGVTRRLGIALQNAQNCRITRCWLRLSAPPADTHWVGIGGNSNNNRVDHCEFGPFTGTGKQVYIYPTGNATIPGVTPPADRTSWANGNGPFNPNVARNTRIDHNWLHDKPGGTSEPIILGGFGMTGDYQDLNTIVEYNLFQNANGDSETISVKSSSNIMRYNTVRTTAGGFVSRAGNKNQFIGNFFLQGNVAGSVGVRLHEKDHLVYNNYIENAGSEPINVYSGDPYNSGFTHAQVFRARIVHNTVVIGGGRPVTIGGGGNVLPPQDCVFANNILTGASQLLNLPIPGNTVFNSNIANGTLGYSRPSSEFMLVNPALVSGGGVLRLSASSPAIGFANPSYYSFVTDDMDGQGRSAPDAGSDEYSTGGVLRRPLTSTDVGPNAP